MNRPLIFTALLGCFLTGCQSARRPMPGQATLELSVTAEPKIGVVTGNTHVLSYDAPTASANVSGQFEKVDYTSLDEIVVWIQPMRLATTAPAAPVSDINLNPLSASDSLTGVTCVGGQITLHNQSATPMNFYSVSDGNNFDMGIVPAGGSASYRVASPGLIEILTDSVKDPIGQVYAAPTPWVRKARAGETVQFANIPPGQYKIISWHPRLPGQETTATLSPDQISTVSIKVGVNGLPKVEDR